MIRAFLDNHAYTRGPMKFLAVLIGVFALVVGFVGVTAPSALLRAADYVTTPIGLYAAAVIRISIGIVLLLASRNTRAPKLIRLFGGIAVAAGVFTAFVGVDRARAILAWETAQGPTLIRLSAVLALVFGGLIVFAVSGRRIASVTHNQPTAGAAARKSG